MSSDRQSPAIFLGALARAGTPPECNALHGKILVFLTQINKPSTLVLNSWSEEPNRIYLYLTEYVITTLKRTPSPEMSGT